MNLSQGITELRRKFPTDWRMARSFRVPRGTPGEPYYLEWDPGVGAFGERWNTFDGDGVFFNGSSYNPVSIAQFALHEHQQLCDGNEQSRGRFMAQVRYLERAMRQDGALPYTIPLPQYGVRGQWLSGLAQGEAASVFFRACAVTGEERYRALGLRALVPLRLDVTAGGTSTLVPQKAAFFEEISAAPCHILNGHLCAAFAVWEACRYGYADEELRTIHELAIATLARWLPRFDAGGWSYYQLADRSGERRFASIFYHQIHIAQLNVYAAMTGVEAFSQMADKWKRGLQRSRTRMRVWSDSLQWFAGVARRKILRVPYDPWKPSALQETLP